MRCAANGQIGSLVQSRDVPTERQPWLTGQLGEQRDRASATDSSLCQSLRTAVYIFHAQQDGPAGNYGQRLYLAVGRVRRPPRALELQLLFVVVWMRLLQVCGPNGSALHTTTSDGGPDRQTMPSVGKVYRGREMCSRQQLAHVSFLTGLVPCVPSWRGSLSCRRRGLCHGSLEPTLSTRLVLLLLLLSSPPSLSIYLSARGLLRTPCEWGFLQFRPCWALSHGQLICIVRATHSRMRTEYLYCLPRTPVNCTPPLASSRYVHHWRSE